MTDSPKRIRMLRNGDPDVDGHVMIGGSGKTSWWTTPATPYWHYDLEETHPKPPPTRLASVVDCPGPPIFDETARAKLRAAIDRARDE